MKILCVEYFSIEQKDRNENNTVQVIVDDQGSDLEHLFALKDDNIFICKYM